MSDPRFVADPNLSAEKLLQAIGAGLIDGSHRTTLLFMMGPFSALLVRLSRDSEKTAQQVVRLTKWLIGLTIALLLLGGVTFAKDAYELYKDVNQQAQYQPVHDNPKPQEPQRQSRAH